MISGRYVKTFAEASHALPNGMHMNADYPFMLPLIEKVEGKLVTIVSGPHRTTFTIEPKLRDRECGYIEQSSTYEHFMGRGPTRFRLDPFKDERTPAVGDASIPDASAEKA